MRNVVVGLLSFASAGLKCAGVAHVCRPGFWLFWRFGCASWPLVRYDEQPVGQAFRTRSPFFHRLSSSKPTVGCISYLLLNHQQPVAVPGVASIPVPVHSLTLTLAPPVIIIPLRRIPYSVLYSTPPPFTRSAAAPPSLPSCRTRSLFLAFALF